MRRRLRPAPCPAESARRRTGYRPEGRGRLPSSRGSAASASEGLPDADIDSERSVAVALVERDADVEPRRTEAGIVAHADARAESRRELREVGHGVGVGTAGVDEGDRAPRLTEALAELEARL